MHRHNYGLQMTFKSDSLQIKVHDYKQGLRQVDVEQWLEEEAEDIFSILNDYQEFKQMKQLNIQCKEGMPLNAVLQQDMVQLRKLKLELISTTHV